MTNNTTSRGLLPGIQKTINTLNLDYISSDRKALLHTLIDVLAETYHQEKFINLNFICTHNSRRSHLSQIWAQTMAYLEGFSQVTCYSGGTEATAIFPEVVKSLEKTGFMVQKLSADDNPIYSIKYANNQQPIIGFSKKFDDAFNPSSDFMAIMTCDSAYESCPIVSGATHRLPITYQDPKKFDHTPAQEVKYMERSMQIATEMHYIFSTLKGL